MQLFMLYFLQHFNVFNPTSVVKQPYNVAPPSCKFVYNPHELSIVISIINHSYCWAFQCFANQGLHVLPARHWLRARDVTALICLRRSPFFEGQPRNVLGWWMNKSKFLCSMGWIRLYQLFCWICWAYVSHLFWACTVSVCIPHDLTNSSGEMLQWWHPGVTWLQCSCCTFHPTRHLLPPQEKSEQPRSPAAQQPFMERLGHVTHVLRLDFATFWTLHQWPTLPRWLSLWYPYLRIEMFDVCHFEYHQISASILSTNIYKYLQTIYIYIYTYIYIYIYIHWAQAMQWSHLRYLDSTDLSHKQWPVEFGNSMEPFQQVLVSENWGILWS